MGHPTLLPRQLLLVLPGQVVQALFPRQAALIPSQEGMQAGQVLIPSQTAIPQAGSIRSSLPGERTCSAGTLPRQALVEATQAAPCVFQGLSPQRGGNTLEGPGHKWVINLSSKPLTKAQRSLLAKVPNYVVTPRHPSNLEYITAIESACIKLS